MHCFVHFKYPDFKIWLFKIKVEKKMNVRIMRIHFFVEFKDLNSGKNGLMSLLFCITE